jgi:hypothetical protein
LSICSLKRSTKLATISGKEHFYLSLEPGCLLIISLPLFFPPSLISSIQINNLGAKENKKLFLVVVMMNLR